jgi:hypothetical protein
MYSGFSQKIPEVVMGYVPDNKFGDRGGEATTVNVNGEVRASGNSTTSWWDKDTRGTKAMSTLIKRGDMAKRPFLAWKTPEPHGGKS